MSIPANNNYHVEQSWTENLESLNCSFNFTSSYVNGAYSYAEKDAHWFGVPYISSNDTVGIEYEFDTCNGRLEYGHQLCFLSTLYRRFEIRNFKNKKSVSMCSSYLVEIFFGHFKSKDFIYL